MRKTLAWLAGIVAAGTTLVVPRSALATTPDCAALGFGAVATGVIQSAGQTDCFSFPGVAGDRIRVRVVETQGDLWAQTRVLRSDGTEVCGRNVYRESTCMLDSTGTHQVRIRDDAGTALGKYSVTLQRLNDPVGCSAVRFDQTVSASITVAAETNCWKFRARAGAVARLGLQGTYGIVNPEVEVVRPDGSTMCSNGYTRPCSLDTTGTYTLFGRDNPGTWTGNYNVSLSCDTPPCVAAATADFDGDGMTDIAVYRPSSGTWFLRFATDVRDTVPWGQSDDTAVPADYDGDGTAEIAVYRAATGTWSIDGGPSVGWGIGGDIPVPGDYNGDGKTDMAVYRPGTGAWFVNGSAPVSWGIDGDIPVPGDYNGDGKTDVAVYRPVYGTWFVKNGNAVLSWGMQGDIPLPLPDAVRRLIYGK